MTVTVASFRGAFPAFADPAKYTEPEVTFWLGFAALRHNPDRWGDLLDLGVQLFVAHNLALEYNARLSQKAGQGAGAVVGALTSVTADKVSWTRDSAPATNPSDGHWNLTSYGMRWKEMVRLVGAGGLQIGVPSPEEERGAYGAWPGPFPSPW